MKPVHIYKVPCILSFALISTLTLSAAIPDPSCTLCVCVVELELHTPIAASCCCFYCRLC